MHAESKGMENLEREQQERKFRYIMNEEEKIHADRLSRVTEERRQNVKETQMYKRRFEEEQERSEEVRRTMHAITLASEEEKRRIAAELVDERDRVRTLETKETERRTRRSKSGVEASESERDSIRSSEV